MPESIAIHTNTALKHQAEFASYLQLGFRKHGLNAQITTDIYQQADLHVVLGPHYAKQQWLGHRTLLLDRGWWGDSSWDVSLSWMTPEGGHTITDGNLGDRPQPELQPWKERETHCLVLADYGMIVTPQNVGDLTRYRVTIRPHPATVKPYEGLHDALSRHDLAVGFGTTALVAAAIHGLPCVCLDARNVAAPVGSSDLRLRRPDRRQWLNNLSYHHYNGNEIADGTAWAFLKSLS